MEFFLAYDTSFSNHRGKDIANLDFLSPLPLPPIKDDISGPCVLSDPDDLSIYLIRTCGFLPSFYPKSDVGLGGEIFNLILQSWVDYLLPKYIFAHTMPQFHNLQMVGSVDRIYVVSAGNPHLQTQFELWRTIPGHSILDAREAKERSWQALLHLARIIV